MNTEQLTPKQRLAVAQMRAAAAALKPLPRPSGAKWLRENIAPRQPRK